MNYSFDLDGVLADFVGGMRKHFHRYGFGRSQDDPVTPAEWSTILKDHLFATLPALPGTSALARHWLNGAPNTYFITSRPAETRDDTLNWLFSHDLIPYDGENLIFATPAGEKLSHLKRLAPVMHLDDGLPLVALADAYKGIDAYLLRRPWNEQAVRQFKKIRVLDTVRDFLAKAAS